jgi:ABC-type transport system involved in cytochrome c biogenesis permease subunit
VNRLAFWIIVCTLVVHTGALAARVAISGRPPVTNLYSSAVFIGWGCVIFGVVLERLLKLGVGNIVASSAGFVTLVIADKLAMDGETMAVMQAVLDTQFWLSTHVVCITLGYSATFVAGLLGVVYLFARFVPGALDAVVSKRQGAPLSLGKALGTMMYGVICFAVFFSFWGTVLGGLWADDSWGRFWGWDPKENGALMIVIWNAIMLHALWVRMVGDRGLAMLSVGGNIVTSWSWFGVNELGVGLHAYGFTEGVLLALSLTMLAHLLVIASGFLPTFRSRHNEPAAASMA